MRILRALHAVTPLERAHFKNANHYVLLDDGRDISKRKYASGAQKSSNKLLSEQARAKYPKITHLVRPVREEAIQAVERGRGGASQGRGASRF